MLTMRKLLAVTAAIVAVLVLGTGCEPAMAITARNDTPSVSCFQSSSGALGSIDPANATNGVVLQRTSGGKWVDWKWPEIKGDPPTLRTAPVVSGNFYIEYAAPGGATTLHLRVRSDGGTVSPGFYVTVTCP